MALSKDDLAAIAAMIAQSNASDDVVEQDEVTTKVLKDAPKPSTQGNVKRSRGTAAKASSVADRKLKTFVIAGGKSPREIAAGAPLPDGIAFVVAPVTQPHRTGGTLTTAGSRLYAYQDGRALKSWTGPVVAAFTGDVQEAAEGVMAQVDELALIGAHRPVKASDEDQS